MSYRKKTLAIVLTAVMVLSVMAFAPAAASASNHHLVVDDSFDEHNDDHDGDNEFQTIQAAVDAAEPGDVIEVRKGTYTENVMVDKHVVLKGAGVGSTILNANQSDEPTLVLGADNIEFRGFTVNAPSDGPPAIAIWDLIHDSYVQNVLVENNRFVGNDNTVMLGYASPPSSSTDRVRQITIRNNEFTGGSLGSMQLGFVLNARNSTMAGNTFDTKVNIASLAVTGPYNTIQNTQINYPGYAFSGLMIGPGGHHTMVDTLTVDGHLDEHQHEDPTRGDWLKYGVYVAGSHSTLTNVDSHQSHIGIYIGTDHPEFQREVATTGFRGVTGVTVMNSMADENRNHDLEADRGVNKLTVRNFQAKSSVMPVENEWSGFLGRHPSSGANVYVANGSGHLLSEVTTTAESPIGIRLEGHDSMIKNAVVRNKGGPAADLDGDQTGEASTTGISIVGADDNLVTGSVVTHNDVGVAIKHGDGNVLRGNNPGIYNNTNAGVWLYDADDTLLADNDVQDNGVGLWAKKSDPVRAKYNNFVGNGQGVHALAGSHVNARWNWFGAADGPSGPATAGALSGSGDSIAHDGTSEIKYDPFLTAPKDEVKQDPDKTVQFAHDFVTRGSQGIQTIGTPGPATVTFQFSTQDAVAWTYDAAQGSFTMMTGSSTTQASTLQAYLISDLEHDEHARVVVDFSDSVPSTPGARSLSDGWNFIAAPQHGDTEDVIRSTTEILRVAHGYNQFDSQPYGVMGDTSAFSYPMGSDSDGPELSPYAGYWIHADGGGSMTAAVPSGVTITEEQGLIVT